MGMRRLGKRAMSQFTAGASGGPVTSDAIDRFVLTTLRRLVERHQLNDPFLKLLVSTLSRVARRELVRRLQAIVLPDYKPRPKPTKLEFDGRPKPGPRGRLGALLEDLEEKVEHVPEDDDTDDIQFSRHNPFSRFEEPADGDRELPAERIVRIIRRWLFQGSAEPKERELAMGEVISGLLAEILEGDGEQADSTPPQLASLSTTFGLGESELRLFTFFLAYAQLPVFESFCDSHHKADWPRLMAAAAGCEPGEVQTFLSESGPLLRSGILERGMDRPPYFDLSQTVVDYVTGFSDRPLEESFFKVYDGPVHDVESFQVDDNDRNLVLGMLRHDQPCHILLHGAAGTGKTEFARALIRTVCKRTCVVKMGDEGLAGERRVALFATSRAVRPSEAIIIIDEADSLLNTLPRFPFIGGDVDKGWLNTFIDVCDTKVIWITNDIDRVPPSLRRRFSYSVEFHPFTRGQRLALWRRCAAKSKLGAHLDEAALQRLSRRFHVDAGGIADSLSSVERMLWDQAPPAGAVEEILNSLLARHRELVHGQPPREVVETAQGYRADALSIDVDQEALLESLRQTVETEDARSNLLFWGPPGTGKTEFARYLAATLGMDLVVKSASDLLDMYLGGTEKKIREAFEEAAREEAILFIDEADSFFVERATAHRSWEVSQTNELLQRMERHRGILICCTNFLHGLDRAALRRFNWKVEFQPLDPAQVVTVYEEYFGEGRPPLSSAQLQRLRGCEGLTFGDFAAVRGRFAFVAPDALDHDGLIDALKRELSYRQGSSHKRIGFQGGRA